MSSLRHTPRPKQKLGQKALAKLNQEIQHKLLGAAVAEEEADDDDLRVEEDPPEPPQLEDLGDSAAFVEDGPPGSIFDRAWNGALPLIKQLPKRLRPPVRYRIDGDLVVHALYKVTTDRDDFQHAVAWAIAEHLRKNAVVLDGLGDWTRIPAIGTDPDLESLIQEVRPDLFVEGQFKGVASGLKDFAVELPNRDVVAPQSLITRARQVKGKGKDGKPGGWDSDTTRAAALRVATTGQRSTMPCGEAWGPEDWQTFEDSQRSAAGKYRKRNET